MFERLSLYWRALLVVALLGCEWLNARPLEARPLPTDVGAASASLNSSDNIVPLAGTLQARGSLLPGLESSAPLPQDSRAPASGQIQRQLVADYSHAATALEDCSALAGQSLQLRRVRLQL